jgi:hypothetical protein
MPSLAATDRARDSENIFNVQPIAAVPLWVNINDGEFVKKSSYGPLKFNKKRSQWPLWTAGL